MPIENDSPSAAKQWQECTDVHDFLEQVRLRPGMWLPGGSLRTLQSMLVGYRVALGVHAVDEPFDFWHGGKFSQWLDGRIGVGALGWAAAVERETPAGSTPVEEFFRLLDEYRRAAPPAPGDGPQEPAAATAPAGPPGGIAFMANTFVTLFWRRRLLDEATAGLERDGYRIVRLTAGDWSTEKDMHCGTADALGFPDYYGHNLDALDDCLGDVACLGPYDGSPEGAGLVLVLTDYDRFAAACPDVAHAVLDLIAGQARRASVLRRRVVCLVHSNDPGIRFDPVGAMPVLWNDKEWLDAARR
ncbi:barstar family protein [Streptomyces sp. NPDC037389]|uniref:barstar family protein n=1 Tax=Streptomyces sp. NPDC037389 TaxID=3155369 RepID=UPI0033E5E633